MNQEARCIYHGSIYELVCCTKTRAKIRSRCAEFAKRVWFRRVYTNTKWVRLDEIVELT
jgi:hypothetical protein